MLLTFETSFLEMAITATMVTMVNHMVPLKIMRMKKRPCQPVVQHFQALGRRLLLLVRLRLPLQQLVFLMNLKGNSQYRLQTPTTTKKHPANMVSFHGCGQDGINVLVK